MTLLYGLLGINDSERVFLSTLGQSAVYDVVKEVTARYNADLNAAMGIFVERTTSDFKIRYKLPGGGRMQRQGFAPQSVPAAVKATGGWDVAFPLESMGDALGGDRISMAYMTAQDLDRHIQTTFIRHTNTVKFEILKALFNNTERTFVDPHHGSLLVEPLANGDAVVYPPVMGSEAEATDDHYSETGYLSAAIDSTHNPLQGMVSELEEHFGYPTGGSNIVVFINNAETAKISALPAFVEVEDRFIRPGVDTAQAIGLPPIPGRILGRCDGTWVSEWRSIPANYLLGLHLDALAPLIKRVDPADTGLGQGLQLVAKDDSHPIDTSYYEDRLGFGVANRLNGVVVELGNGGGYSIPAAYA